MATAALASRMQREIKKLAKHPPPGISAWPSSENSVAQLQVQMQGPPDTPYEAGLFRLELVVPQRYPFEPPKLTFKTPVYHPNVDAQGRICLDVLNMPPKGSWGPALDLSKVLIAVRQLLAEPNPKDPLVVDIADECASQPELFKVKARQHVLRHARPHAGPATLQPAVAAAAAAAGGGGGEGPAGGGSSVQAQQEQQLERQQHGDGQQQQHQQQQQQQQHQQQQHQQQHTQGKGHEGQQELRGQPPSPPQQQQQQEQQQQQQQEQ